MATRKSTPAKKKTPAAKKAPAAKTPAAATRTPAGAATLPTSAALRACIGRPFDDPETTRVLAPFKLKKSKSMRSSREAGLSLFVDANGVLECVLLTGVEPDGPKYTPWAGDYVGCPPGSSKDQVFALLGAPKSIRGYDNTWVDALGTANFQFWQEQIWRVWLKRPT